MSGKKYQRLDFTPAKDELLTEKVRENPPLYVKKLKTYKDIQLRENIWRKIQKEMEEAGYNRAVEDCKKRWTNLRDYYAKRKRASTTGSAAHDAKESLKNLKFLDENTIVHRPTTSNIAEENEETEEPNYCSEITAESTATTLTATTLTATTSTATTLTATTSTATTSTATTSRKRTRSQVFEIIEKGREERIKLLRQLVNKEQEVNHIDSFFKSLADIAKTWSPLYYAQARRQISNIITELDIEYLSKNINNSTEDGSE